MVVAGHGLWNDLNVTASLLWLDSLGARINATMPWLAEQRTLYPRLFITPTHAGLNKPEEYFLTQGNRELSRFERAMGPVLRERGYDHLGTFNLTTQSTSPDGTHAGWHANLIKAMIVFNWMSWLE